MKAFWLRRFLWLSLFIHPYQSSHFVSLSDGTWCLHWANAYKFLLVCPCVGINKRTSLIMFVLTSTEYLTHRSWMVCEMGVKWPYNYAACKICSKQHAASLCNSHLAFSPSILLVVQPYSSTDTLTAWKNSCFILSERLDFYIIDNLSITFLALIMQMLTWDGTILIKTHELYFIWVHKETNAFCCLLQTILQNFGFSWSAQDVLDNLHSLHSK